MRVTVVIPCLDEENTVAKVVGDYLRLLPGCSVVVVDNGSTDGTSAAAAAAGAKVLDEPLPGKGNAVRRAFRSIESDIILLVDGDDTIPAEQAVRLVDPVSAGRADLAVGTRLARNSSSSFRSTNRLGNGIFRLLVNAALGTRFTDVLCGYRALSDRAVRCMSLVSRGFEIEVEMTMEASARGLRIEEVPVDLRPRHAASRSKIRILMDGARILRLVASMILEKRPMPLLLWKGAALLAAGAVAGLAVHGTLSVVLLVILGALGAGTLCAGLVLDAGRTRHERLEERLECRRARGDRP